MVIEVLLFSKYFIYVYSICCSISSPQSWVSPAIIGGGGILAIIQYYSVLLWNKRKGINLVEDLNELKIQNNPGEKHGG